MVNKKSGAPKPKAQNLSSKLSTPPAALLSVSAFSPPALHLSLFASVVLGLDAYRLRIHDTNTGRLRCEHVFEKGISVNSLVWGLLPPKDKKSAKKRRRLSNGNGSSRDEAKSAVVAAATSRGTVVLFSPSEGAVVGVLEGEHTAAASHFVFSEEKEGRGWSCGADAKLVEWDIGRKLPIRYVVYNIQSRVIGPLLSATIAPLSS